MSKNPRKKRKHDRIASNAEWLHGSLESTPLDLDALASMPTDEVKSDLKKYNVKSNASFIKELNGKLPEGISIKATKAAATKKRQVGKSSPAPAQRDRKPVKHSQGSRLRVFSIRNAFILSALTIGVLLLGPPTIDLINQGSPGVDNNVLLQPDTTDVAPGPPTSLEFEFPAIKIQGVSYRLENFQGLVPQFSPLPSNPDSLDRTFTFVMIVNSNGNVVGLQSEQMSAHPFEKAIMDSLFMWRFYGGEHADTTSGTIEITYETEIEE